MTRKEKAAAGAAVSVLFAVGFVQTLPILSVLMIGALIACIRYGELWEA